MRAYLIAASTLAVAACQQDQHVAPTNVIDALTPYYAQLEVDPKRQSGWRADSGRGAGNRVFRLLPSRRLPARYLDTISAQQGDLFIYTGDNVYDAYSWDATLPELREAYATLRFSPSRTCASPPMLATWRITTTG